MLFRSRTPRTRSDWERIYRATQGVPQSEQGRRGGPGIVRGIDIHTNWRPRYVFGLQPGASTADINRAYRGLAKQLHPDAGGRAKDMARITAMRDTLLALQPKPKPAKGSKRGKAAAQAPPAPRGPLALPPARGRVMAPAGGAKPAPKPARKSKTPDDLLTQATRIEIRGRRMSRAAKTGFRDRQIESRAVNAANAARAKAFEMQKPKPESKTTKAKRERDERRRYREQLANASRLIRATRKKR